MLIAKVDKSLVTAVSLTSPETEILEAQVIVEQSLDAVKNQVLSFNDVTTVKAIEERKNTLLAQVKNLEAGMTEAFLKLGDKDKGTVKLIFQKKIEEITSEATSHAKLLKTAEESITRFVGQFNLPISFVNDFTKESIQLHARILMTQIKTLSRSKNLQAAQSTLGFKIHPAIDQAIKEKTAEISTLVQTRLNSLNQAMLIIENTAKTIAEFPVVIPDLHSVTAFQEEQVKQVKLVQALMVEPTVLEAHRQLGIQGQHPLLTAAFNTKQQVIDQAIQSKLTIIVDANKKVQAYHASIRAVTSDFSKAATEKDIITVFLTFIKEMDRIRTVIDADKGIAVIPSAKTDLLAAWQTHQQFAQEANIVAHNRVIYAQIQTALDKSDFAFALNQIGRCEPWRAEGAGE